MTNEISTASVAAAQVPPAGLLYLDHVACFAPRMDDAQYVFAKLGFTLTPFSAQSHRLTPQGPLAPAGTGNCCIMLEQGYLECLTPTGATQVADQLRAAITRYVGNHLIAFGTASADADYTRLAEQGFAPLDPVALQRQIATPHGEETARFTVVRVAPGTMAEGRIQFCRQHTPQLLWQTRWLGHQNRATALTAVVLCVADPAGTAARYASFTGINAVRSGDNWLLRTARGSLLFVAPEPFRAAFGIEPPALPWIAGCALASNDMAATRQHMAGSGYASGNLDLQRIYVIPPASVGGVIIFEPVGSDMLTLSTTVH